MPGIIDRQAPVDPGQADPVAPNQMPSDQTPPEQAAPEQGGNRAGPDEQAMHDKIVSAASEMLYDESSNGQVMEMLKQGAKDPATTVSGIRDMVFGQIEAKAEGQIPVSAILPASFIILEMIGELASESGIFEYGEAEHTAAIEQTIDTVAAEHDVSEEEVQAFLAEQGAEVPQAEQAPPSQPGAQQPAAQGPAAQPGIINRQGVPNG